MRVSHAAKEELPYMTNTSKVNANIINQAIEQSWSKIAPFWPLKNLIAINPLQGFEDLPFEEAIMQGQAYFQQKDLPEEMQIVNRETIKWLQVFFDDGQATIKMPLRNLGFLNSIRKLLILDKNICKFNSKISKWLQDLPESPQEVITACLSELGIPSAMQVEFMILLLTTLPGWAAYIKYLTAWGDPIQQHHSYSASQAEYLAFRLILTSVIFPEGKSLLRWHDNATQTTDCANLIENICKEEEAYRKSLLANINKQAILSTGSLEAQLVFCIDTRSEPLRRAIESHGCYETFGFAGFFGIPVRVENSIRNQSYSSCPVLLKPNHCVQEHPACSHHQYKTGCKIIDMIKSLYQSVKYNFTTTFALVETLGLSSGVWMFIRSIFPSFARSAQKMLLAKLHQFTPVVTDIASIPFVEQYQYAENALRMMGLTDNFAPLVVFCGHGSTTQNNSSATALDCGACGGRHGGANARILANILNMQEIRNCLKKSGIFINPTTYFLAAEHNTTTDLLEFYDQQSPQKFKAQIQNLKNKLQISTEQNNQWRCSNLQIKYLQKNASNHTMLRAHDWAQVRPEWGLARNAAFIIGPRTLTQSINLEGRVFLHSYDWSQDNCYDWSHGEPRPLLTTILTAPMIVAQWINSQYLFSTLDNVAFGAGSKITENITGKIGVMQGNASDLMHGLPLQSVFKTDQESYHRPLRLLTIVYAPRSFIEGIIAKQAILQKLFKNKWVTLCCIDPLTNKIYQLEMNLKWKQWIQD